MMKRPNILLLVSDQHRSDWMPYDSSVFHNKFGIEPLPLNMPNIKKLMEEGMTFTRAITPSPLCAPARACLASGLRYPQCGVRDNHMDYPLGQRTFYSVLQENGYDVSGVGKFDLHKPTHWWGLDGWIDDLEKLGFTRGIDNAGKMDAVKRSVDGPKDSYMKYLYDRGLAELHIADMIDRKLATHPTPLPEEAYCDNWITDNGLKMLESAPQKQPWFLQVNFAGPHNPFDVTEAMRKRWESTDFPPPLKGSGDVQQHIKVRQNYAAMLENIDRNIGLLIDQVKRRGEWEQTIIIYTSDHGEMLGDFGYYGKNRPEQASVQIPLVIYGPGVQSGVYSDALVEWQDLVQTFMEFTGSTMPEAADSQSLCPTLTGSARDTRTIQYSALDIPSKGLSWEMIADGQYKLILSKYEPNRLYDVKNDPRELQNLANIKPEVVERLLQEKKRTVQ